MTLYFRTDQPDMMARKDQFLALCRRKLIHGTMKRTNTHIIVRPTCKNVTEERKLLSAWSDETIEIVDGGGGGRKMPLFGRSKKSRK